MIRRPDDLLRANECETLEDLEAMCTDLYLDDDVLIWPMDEGESEPGVLLTYTPGWAGDRHYQYLLSYPFTNEEFWEAIDDLGDLYRFEVEIEALPEAIAIVEGLQVEVLPLPSEDGPPHHRMTVLGWPIHDVPVYSYRRAMSGARTVGEWKRTRFEPSCPGFTVEVVGRGQDGSSEPLTDDVRLADARRFSA